MTQYGDQVFQFGGVPVASANNYVGWWSEKVYFVDYDNGTAGAAGKKPDKAQKNLATAISNADKWDTIYIRPRDAGVSGGDPQAITPASATNWSIPNTKWGLSLIGTGIGARPDMAAYQTRLQGYSTVTGTAPLTVLAPYVVIENLSFKRGGSTGVPLVNLSSAGGTANAFAANIHKCQFHMGNGTSGGAGAVQISSYWYAVISDSHFERCNVAIGISSSVSNPCAVRISGNTFNQPAASNYGDIVSAATAVNRILIDNNMFNHDIPSKSGGKARYLWFSGSNTGSVINNYFGTGTLVTATIMTLASLVESGSICAKGFLTS